MNMGNRLGLFACLGSCLCLIWLVSCQAVSRQPVEEVTPVHRTSVELGSKIDGVAFVSPPNKIGDQEAAYILESNAGWVEYIPYGYGYPNSPKVKYDVAFQWWGERFEGTRKMIRSAKSQGLKVMVKPHIWIIGKGWAGDFKMTNDQDWEVWEDEYKEYIMTFARMAEEEKVELFCVGTELKAVTQARPYYFGALADSVRKVFSGKITYASNWDNYEQIRFWDKMDLVGVDGYFPLLEDQTPEVAPLVKAWEAEKRKLKATSEKTGKPILFAEWGYLSMDQSGWRTWELEGDPKAYGLNLTAQRNCYEAFFEALWDEPWFAGGFVWQWYCDAPNAGGSNDKDHTPQNKPAFEVLKKWYGKQ